MVTIVVVFSVRRTLRLKEQSTELLWLPDAFCVRNSLRWNKQLNIELKNSAGDFDCISPIDEIKLMFAARMQNGLMRDAVE